MELWKAPDLSPALRCKILLNNCAQDIFYKVDIKNDHVGNDIFYTHKDNMSVLLFSVDHFTRETAHERPNEEGQGKTCRNNRVQVEASDQD